ncbi:hypothetical protein JSO56_10115 [Riemerella anatipestifer]|uniref:hypothetical protein n=1 Tax=Riemerella anatipestifer TaxID=34085 RepID=UPI0030BF918C
MKEKLSEKIREFVNEITTDKRWNIKNQTLFDTLGLTLSGYACGIGRHFWFLDDEIISEVLLEELTNIGGGEKYVKSLIDFALSTFEIETKNYQSELVGIGYFRFSDRNFEKLKESIFENAMKIEEQLKTPKTEVKTNNLRENNKKWWQFWK